MEEKLVFPDFSLNGKRALVTGAGGGIGRALALGLVNAGATVAITGRDPKKLAAVADEATRLGGQAFGARLDVRDIAGLVSDIGACVARLGGLDILVNNAGVEQVCDSLFVDETLWDKIVDTNLKGAFFCAQAAGRAMAAAGGGTIVNLC
ncbi:hypothetical protein DSCO28_19420 [Desulfosarcina ovata subsp. sediminis]|uniref:Uncharacterized protein n=1 Tax=Desulfosarcina ovata subsp. sediminis TaxID=885957 RepID=A0A5K7ZK22_9BACT|nr:SDR family NAD(P)-dependent oxidoreductase [Desulfosarcina ovata]BBO81376.1 hypothetical protein DSCO28_19420 [Desulfosarcina ovata subsp. sediminis]